MTTIKENISSGYTSEDVELSADELSLEFLRDNRRYCRKLSLEVDE